MNTTAAAIAAATAMTMTSSITEAGDDSPAEGPEGVDGLVGEECVDAGGGGLGKQRFVDVH